MGKKGRFGKQKPRYRFFLNYYTDHRFTKCPGCDGKMRQRKLPLVILIKDWGVMTVNFTCRYCPECDILIAHQDVLEGALNRGLEQVAPEQIGKDYLVAGTVDRELWRRGTKEAVEFQELENELHDFREYLDVEVTGGWVLDESRAQ